MEQRVNTLTEKVARMEAQLEQVLADREEMKDKLDQATTALQAILNKISKWEGKFGGILFVIGCLWAFFSGFGKAIQGWIMTFGVPGK
jgi:hypothetical protein